LEPHLYTEGSIALDISALALVFPRKVISKLEDEERMHISENKDFISFIRILGNSLHWYTYIRNVGVVDHRKISWSHVSMGKEPQDGGYVAF
jgi:hypothetical protein